MSRNDTGSGYTPLVSSAKVADLAALPIITKRVVMDKHLSASGS